MLVNKKNVFLSSGNYIFFSRKSSQKKFTIALLTDMAAHITKLQYEPRI